MPVRSIAEILTPSSQTTAEIKIHLEDLRRVRSALATLSATLKTTIPLLEKQFSDAFIYENFARLPDDIFAIIFEFAGSDDLQSTIRFSQVCWRFRAITLSIPRLWTFICPRSQCRMSDVFGIARRSQSCASGIMVKISSSNIRPYNLSKNEHIEYVHSLMGFVGT